ncbi:hypothetical protein [Occallatibacter riparius]|uniref:DUF2269 family protein n=1 Tax=Occallatibacter riparius TaxID=1002689 RepID=A0A9J7BVM0_9BACT|nr:hypothetical protein [Occallatibacter riparius]UWZ86916.1 hypothetical protein MOP44_13430 [Occallatibacter riparius]
MLAHSIVLITHIAAVFVLCAVLSIEALSLRWLRRASNFGDAHPWIEPVPRLRMFAIGSVLLIQATGIDLIHRTSSLGQGWALVAMGSFPVLMAPLGNLTSRRMRIIRAAFRSRDVSESEALRMLRAPFLKVSLAVRVAAFLGVFVLVTVKPGAWAAAGFVVTSLSLALLVSLSPWRRMEPPIGRSV